MREFDVHASVRQDDRSEVEVQLVLLALGEEFCGHRSPVVVRDYDPPSHAQCMPQLFGNIRLLAWPAIPHHLRIFSLREHPWKVTAAVLLALSRGRASVIFRLCRALKTDGRDPPAVGLIDRWSRLEDPSASLTSCLGDGYLGGQLAPEEIRRWAGRLIERRGHVVVTGPAEQTFRDRLFRRKR